MLVWGFIVPTVCLYHATFAINSLAHIVGTRLYATGDDSRNNAVLALLTLGEGWHNNHHHCMSSARQGVRWWEIDLTFIALRALAACGVVRDLRSFVAHARRRRASEAA
jgi:stearoyl-CoA desaturase (delta-9 desaturase)